MKPYPFLHRTSVTIAWLMLLVVFFGAGLMSSVMAEDTVAEDTTIYTYVGQIDENAENPVDAKKLGVLKAKMTGLQTVLKAMVPLGRHENLPTPDKNSIDLFVRSISFANERFGGGRYLADLRVDYDSEQIRALLRRERLPFAETTAPRLLIIPVLQIQNASQLWEPSNTWHAKWQEGFSSSPLVPLVIPDGGFANWTAITPEQAVSGEVDRLKAIQDKYKAQGSVVAIARVTENGEQSTLAVDLATYAIGLEEWRKTVYNETFSRELLMENLQVAKEIVVSQIEEEWKRRNLLPFDQEINILKTTLFIADISEWVQVRDSLSKVLNIRSLDVKSMTIERVQLQLNYLGTSKQLRTAVAQVGLDLKLDPSTARWTLRLIQE